jgi:hypothetical protein
MIPAKRLREKLATKSKVNERIWYKNKSYERVVFVFYVSVFVVPTMQLANLLKS